MNEIGTRRLHTIASWSDKIGAQRMQLLADRNNASALDFYEKHYWFITQRICLRKQ